VLKDKNSCGQSLLFFAAKSRSIEFIKLLVETDGDMESVTTADIFGMLPIHNACAYANVEAAKYLYSIYPESINIADEDGCYPLHFVLYNNMRPSGHEDFFKILNLTRFMLLHDQGQFTNL
jgi:ankyrin repeat protein